MLVTQQGRPVRVDPVPGTDFGVAYLPVNPTVSGLGIGSMVAGISSTLVALVVICFGVAGSGASSHWGPLVAGAFAILAALLGGGGFAAGLIATRQLRASGGRLSRSGIRPGGYHLRGLWPGPCRAGRGTGRPGELTPTGTFTQEVP